jgi:hypothetical protein
MGTLLPVLLRCCESILKAKVPDDSIPTADDIREEILAEFSLLFADGTAGATNELDFFECRFHLAFRKFRLQFLESATARIEPLVALPATIWRPPSDQAIAFDYYGTGKLARSSRAIPSRHRAEDGVFPMERWYPGDIHCSSKIDQPAIGGRVAEEGIHLLIGQ